jgi:ABC-type sugar transport system ATPase subunit
LFGEVALMATLSVRPEELRIVNEADARHLSFGVPIVNFEQFGSEVLLEVAAGSATIVASVEVTVTAKIRERTPLAIDSDRMHSFGNQTKAAI